MIVNLRKADLTIEEQGLVSNVQTSSGINRNDIASLEFQGFSGFNEKYVKELFTMFSRGTSYVNNLYRVIQVTGNLHNDDTIHTAQFYIIKNTRDTLFLYKTLKSFGITLPDLRIGYEVTDDNKEVLYLDRKIIRIFSSVSEENRRDLTFYFYCLAKFFKAFNSVSIPILKFDTATGKLIIDREGLEEMYKKYTKLPDSVSLDCITMNEDVCFSEIFYLNTQYSRPIKEAMEIKFSSKLVYNVIQTPSTETLCIINMNTNEFYVIDPKRASVYTNSELKEFNTFEYGEWLPYLIANMMELMIPTKFYRIKKVPLNVLLSTKEPEVKIHNDASNFEKLLEKYPTISENTNMKIYDGMFEGAKVITEKTSATLRDMYDDDPYAQELYKQEQPYYDTFDLKDLTGIVKGVVKGEVFSMLFEGESGTGKSTAARVIASRAGLPFIAINCSTNIEESDIFGTMIPNPEKKSAEDPEFIWKDGPMTKAIRNGYMCIIEELGFGRPGVLGKINSLLDESRQVDLPNGEVLKAHPNFRIIATTNIGYEGTNRLNKALVNRFEDCKKFVDLDEIEARAIIKSRTGYTDDDKISKIFEVYKLIKKYSNEQNLGLVVSIRQLLTIFKQGKYFKNAKDAVNNLLINQAFLEEPEHLEFFMKNVMGAVSLTFKI